MQKKQLLNSPHLLKLKKRQRRIFLIKASLFLVAFLAVSAGLVYLYKIPQLNIKGVEVSGNKVIDSKSITEIAEGQIAGNYLWLFPKTNKLFYPKNAIKNELSKKFKRLKNIDIHIKDGDILEISATEREAAYTWCGNRPLAQTAEADTKASTNEDGCYFLDETGYIFDKAPYFSGDIYFKFYGLNDENLADPLGAYFMKESFGKLTAFKKTLEGLQMRPVSAQIEENRDVRILLTSKNTSASGPEISFKLDSDLATVAGNLETALATEPLMSDFKNKYSSLLYIDLRFGNKVYFKFR